MNETVDGLALVIEQLNERIRTLENRVAALEGRTEPAGALQADLPLEVPALTPVAATVAAAAAAAPAPARYTRKRERQPETWQGFPSPEVPSGAIAVLGKAVLGIAGAYLLRAIAESGAVPKLPVLMLAILYAGLWMVWAVRHESDTFASATYATTSALILAPLLWESTVRFQYLSPLFSGAILIAFIVLTLILSWRHDLQIIPWVAMLATVATALALILATHELVPLTAALLTFALAAEIAACFGHQLSLRIVPAVGANLALWLVLFIMTSGDKVPEGYNFIGAVTLNGLCLMLLAIYAASIGARTFSQQLRLTVFEVIQGLLAFGTAALAALRTAHGTFAPVLGVLFLALSAVCYHGALSRFIDDSHKRNRRVFATWAAGLLLAGTLLLFPRDFQPLFLSLAGIIAAYVYTRTAKVSLGLHASLYLACAAAVSPLPYYVHDAFAGAVPGAPHWGVWIVAAAAAACYGVGARHPEANVRRRALWLVPAVILGFAGAAVAVTAVAHIAGGAELAASRLSVIRTVMNCALALVFAFLGAQQKRVELAWAAWVTVAFGTVKILFEDLRYGNAASLVVSLLFYGLILIFLPRLTRRSRAA